MALFNGSDINSPETAFMFNNMMASEFLPIVRKRCWLLNAFMGTPQKGDVNAETTYSRTDGVEGLQAELPILGKLRTLTGVTKGAAERATVNLTAVDGYGAQKFDVAHLKDVLPIEESKLMRYKGRPLKVASFYDEMFRLASLSTEDTLATQLNATYASNGNASVAPAEDRLGSWVHAVSDGVLDAEEANYKTYGMIDRSDAANVDFRSYVKVVPNLTLGEIGLAMLTINGNHGQCRVGTAGLAVFNRIRQLCEGYLDAEIDGEFVDFGGAKVRYAGITFGLDAKAPSGHLGLFDPEFWAIRRKDEPATSEGIKRDPSRLATFVCHYGVWMQDICTKANCQAKLKGIVA